MLDWRWLLPSSRSFQSSPTTNPIPHTSSYVSEPTPHACGIDISNIDFSVKPALIAVDASSPVSEPKEERGHHQVNGNTHWYRPEEQGCNWSLRFHCLLSLDKVSTVLCRYLRTLSSWFKLISILASSLLSFLMRIWAYFYVLDFVVRLLWAFSILVVFCPCDRYKAAPHCPLYGFDKGWQYNAMSKLGCNVSSCCIAQWV